MKYPPRIFLNIAVFAFCSALHAFCEWFPSWSVVAYAVKVPAVVLTSAGYIVRACAGEWSEQSRSFLLLIVVIGTALPLEAWLVNAKWLAVVLGVDVGLSVWYLTQKRALGHPAEAPASEPRSQASPPLLFTAWFSPDQWR